MGETELGIGYGRWKDGGHGDDVLCLSHFPVEGLEELYRRVWRDSELQRRPRGVVEDQYRWMLQVLGS